MDSAAKPSGNNVTSGHQMDFAGPKIRPTVVTSAKAAINARYAEQSKQTASQSVMSAREAVNEAASHSNHDEKAASSLHHGKIQKNIERSQLSASALLRRARSPRPSEEEIKARDSFDPLAGRRLPEMPSSPRNDGQTNEIPVVRTSLKLGASKPKPKPIVLPPNARMARVARPMNRPRPATQNPTLLSRSLDAQIVQPKNTIQATSPKSLSSGKPELPMPPKIEDSDVAVQIISSAKKAALPTKAAPVPVKTRRGAMDFKPSTSRMRPQPQVQHAPASAPLWPQPAQATATRPAAAKPAARPAKFRPMPKGYTQSAPAPLPADNSYVIAAPPKINLAHPHEQTHVSNLEDYYAPRIKPEAADSPKTDSKKRAADNNRYALGGDSPFLKSVNVEKRPLSANAKPRPVAAPVEKSKSNKGRGARKNVYAKKGHRSDSDLRRELPERPTVIIPASRRSKVPLFILIVVTVILGAVVGAAAYLCFFQ